MSLAARTVVGRFPNCDLTLPDARVSGSHAVLLYSSDGWAIRPHATTNGTFLDGVELPPGSPHRLTTVGEVVQFGTSAERWVIRDLGPPAAVARGPGGAVRSSEHLGLALPDIDDVQAMVVYASGQWWIEDASGRAPLRDGHHVVVGDQHWAIYLPADLRGHYTRTSDDTVNPGELLMSFEVSPDGDVIRSCRAGPPGRQRELSVRRHTHLLLELADAHRHGDGWVQDQVLLRRLSLTRNQLHLLTHRARQQILDAGVGAAEPVIEVRGQRTQRQLRLACRSVEIRTEGETW